MRLLFLLSELPFPKHRNGVALINYEILTRAPRDVEIDLIVTGEPEPDAIEGLRACAPQVNEITMVGEASQRRFRVGNLLSGAALGFNMFEHEGLLAALDKTANRHDVVYVSPLMACFDLRRKQPVLLNAVDSFSRLNESMYARSGKLVDAIKWKLYRRYESKVLRTVRMTSFVSHVDRDYVLAHSPALKVACTPNGVDTTYFAPSEDVERLPRSILFTGNFSYLPNAEAAVHFVENILPLIQSKVPGATFYAVGKNPPQALVGRNDVVTTGFVEDIRAYYRSASVFACPLLAGAGMKNKILEAMACGIPIVSTPLGIDGIDGLVSGENCTIADRNEAFADAVVAMLENPVQRGELSARARRLAEQRFGWEAVARQYFHLLATSRLDT